MDAKQANLLYKKECESKSKEYKVSLGMVEKGRGGGEERVSIAYSLPPTNIAKYPVFCELNAFYFPGKFLCRVQ